MHSDRECFAKNCHKTGLFNDTEWFVYDEYHSWLLAQFPTLRPDGVLYMRTQPSTCHVRLRKRARAEEAAVSMDYLQALHERHDEWLLPDGASGATSTDGLPVLSLDADAEFESDPARERALWEDIEAFQQRLRARPVDRN